ncbi:MAG: hypothetical protein SVU32_08745 [Candidatus Nanohaloarchaea archaeon]|nr:hypothetical protein [Candidatus Nanohaloarchaea archaeon]
MQRRDTVLGLLLIGLLLGVGLTAPDREPLTVERVTLRTTGGLAGVNETITIQNGNITHVKDRGGRIERRLNITEQRRVILAVTGPSFHSLENTTYGCREGYSVADTFSHTLIIEYGRGTKRVALPCGLGQHSTTPRHIEQAVRTLQRLGNRK